MNIICCAPNIPHSIQSRLDTSKTTLKQIKHTEYKSIRESFEIIKDILDNIGGGGQAFHLHPDIINLQLLLAKIELKLKKISPTNLSFSTVVGSFCCYY